MEIAIENDLKFSARRQKRTMALRSRLISLTLAQSDSDSLWWLISDLTFQLRDADCIMAEIREVMLLILTHYP